MGSLRCTIVMPLAEQRGGAESALLALLRHGRGLGFAWRVVFLEDGPMVAACAAAGAPSTVLPAGRLRELHRYARTVGGLARALRRDRPDVVVGWMTKAQLYAGPAARLAGAPAVWCQHGMPLPRSALDRVATVLPARGVVAVSQAGARAQRSLAPHRPVAVVHPGIDLARFDPERLPAPAEARARLGLPGAGPLVGVVARLQRWKGVHVLVEALPQVLGEQPELHCVVVGGVHALEPDYEPYLRRRVADLGLEQCVLFAGQRSDVAPWLQAMDVVVSAAADEPFGLTIVEAMALGKPVVAAAGGGPRDIVRDAIDGVLVAPGDVGGLASAVTRVLADPERAARLGRAARQRARAFSSERYAARFAAAVVDLIA
ncbi:MAG TPA: glycosyltransferase [Solirubrobacteraceae bacterium]|nr:glycosyltransferase [Solirubrobacteraceae bacterium]